ncbi:NAD(P)-binding protein [Fusarium austroafricanum]|uniref:NAD(P)-binding protein n=1 Tax=Fusarium austroafricanum TaxID=2364996 RepID=A0A8H4JVF1_9HYPO|nr:NAD(P)-binding protein [Fusarium austroafricanum]
MPSSKLGNHTITALTRTGGSIKIPNDVKTVVVDYEDEATIIDALKGQQFLIITLGHEVSDEIHSRIVASAGKAGVPYIMPNAYCYPINEENIPEGDSFNKMLLSRINGIKDMGLSATFILSCGYWYEWCLALGDFWSGINIKKRRVTFFDDGNRIITVNAWDQCGRAVAGLLSLPEHGPSPCLADYRDRDILIYSFRVSQRDMLDSVNRVMGLTDSDWNIQYEATARRISDGEAEVREGKISGEAKAMYGRTFHPSNANSDFAGTQRVDNEILGLPEESLDEATRRAVEMVESGFNPYGLL